MTCFLFFFSERGTSDFDIMMQRRKEAMAKARRRRKKVTRRILSWGYECTECLWPFG